MLRFLSRLIKLCILLCALGAGLAWWYATSPLPDTGRALDVEVSRGSSMREVARQVVAQGVDVHPHALVWLARLSGRARSIKAGYYHIEPGMTPWSLIELLSTGSSAYVEVALIEGWNFRRVRATLDANPDLRHDTLGLSDAQVMEMLGLAGAAPEGRFFPDTYYFARGTPDIEVLRRALGLMDKVLAAEWATRTSGLPLTSPEEALRLASVVEKETGREEDRGKVASVFVNRLRIGMPLQSDPTVIYGLGPDFNGNLTRRDLQTDTPYNSYTRGGLPPTPIAMPGRAALRATLNPPKTDFLYFVARGDGSSQFSRTLDEHNRAVSRFQRSGR